MYQEEALSKYCSFDTAKEDNFGDSQSDAIFFSLLSFLECGNSNGSEIKNDDSFVLNKQTVKMRL